ncbi:MAG: hypothetical protein GF416_08865 [Candidatus Altiarchaeales archaeon]|nr:hypothetical protein [Candidatus Altiarchaeales archaeon]MBD3417228.1 hypothetical protein [Candidatus Altiarchaeales archaeon]
MRVAWVFLLVFLISISAAAEEPTVLSPLWEDYPVTGLDERVSVVLNSVVDVDGDGFEDVCVVTSGSAGTRNIKNKNHVSVYTKNGTKMWHYGVDDVIKDAMVFDLDRDQRYEIILSSGQILGTPQIHRGSIRILDSRGNLKRKFDSTAVLNDIHIDDVEGDKYYEVVGGSDGRVYLFRSYGERIWNYPDKGDGLLDIPVMAVNMYDMDSNGRKDIIAGSDQLYFINYNGRLMTQVDVEPDLPKLKKGIRRILIGKLTDTGFPDILVVTDSERIIAVKTTEIVASTNENIKIKSSVQWTADLKCTVNDIVMVDLDTDDLDEMLVACSDNKLYALDHNGMPIWDYPLDGEPSQLFIKDVDNDQVEDLLVSVLSGTVYLLDLSGNFKWRHNTGVPLMKVASGNIFGDLVDEVVVVSNEPRIMAFMVNETYNIRRRADTAYNLGQEAYITSDYESALEYFREAKNLYIEVGYEKGQVDSERLITLIEGLLQEDSLEAANIMYSRAQDAFFSGDYASAKTLAEKAMDIYKSNGDREGEVKCELLLLQVEKQLEYPQYLSTLPKSTSSTLPEPEKPNRMLYIVIGVLAVIVILLLVKRRSEGVETIDDSMQRSGSFEEDMMGMDDLDDFDEVK